MGGIDWSGLPYVVEMLGVTDVTQLIERISVIRRPPSEPEKKPEAP